MIKCQYTLFYLLIVVLIQISTVNASDEIKILEISSLGNFEANFSEIEKVEFVKGERLLGEVDYLPGENYSVTFPFDVQRISYLVKNGDTVGQGDKIAIVEGYDVHHFIDEYKSAKILLGIQQQHFQTNKLYFENKTIKRSQWIEITKSYYQAKLNFEHIQHQMSFLNIDENEIISLISPKTGIIQIPNVVNSRVAGELAFDIVDNGAIKVKIAAPILLTSNLSHFLASPSCRLRINSIEKIADKFHQRLWAEPESSNCNLTLGQVIRVIPVQKVAGYKISKTAIFEFNDTNYIAIKANQALSLIPINLIGENEDKYIFTTKENIKGKQGLISSVSIIQGNLLGLGAE